MHLKGTFAMSRHACEYWREEHKKGNVLNGRIINTASDAGLLGNVGQTNYGAAKAAVALMAIVMDAEMQKYGVTLQRHRAGRAHPPDGRRDAVDRGVHGQARSRRASSTSSIRATSRRWSPGWRATTPKDVHGEVFRVGGGTVWLMQGWHTRRQGQPTRHRGIPPSSAAS